jgi:alpha-D-ribose 1-methylphosphonate 5-triphosphate synthase subunit PhnH
MDPVHDTRGCFRALVDAMGRPGTVHESGAAPADYAVVATLVDHEVPFHTPDETIRQALANEGRLTTADLPDASIVHAPEPTDGRVVEMTRGSLKEPSDGATVIYRVDGLAEGVQSAAGWTTLRLSGPGVPDERLVSVRGFPAEEARALAGAQSSYPRGVDAVFATTSDVAAVPRSVELGVA